MIKISNSNYNLLTKLIFTKQFTVVIIINLYKLCQTITQPSNYLVLPIIKESYMIQTYRPFIEGRKPRLLIKKKSDKCQSTARYSCLIKQNFLQADSSQSESQKQDPIKILIRDVFCYRTIKTIVKKQHFIYLKFKETQNQRLLTSSHINRFKNSELKEYQNFGHYLEILDHQMREKSLNCAQKNIYQQKQLFLKQLQQILDQNKEKKIILFYYEPSQKLLNYSQIIISRKLLQELGYDPNEFCNDFLKYKHLFFEIFESSFFEKAISKLAQTYDDFVKENGPIDSMSEKEICELMAKKMKNEIFFSDIIFRRVNDQSGIVEQKLPANFKYFKAQINATMVELESIDQKNIIECSKKKMSYVEKKMRQSSQQKIQEEFQEMKKLMYKSFPLDENSTKKQIAIKCYN